MRKTSPIVPYSKVIAIKSDNKAKGNNTMAFIYNPILGNFDSFSIVK
ncbi:hypothetical protein QIU19_01920 [Capnocytophaga canimorsus]|nr:hypothetical protein [Capnocytophaga canimorsus]WGU68743.1 hypothetical protein QIU19_01920 [Capnocytophaga canimorsus]